MKSILIIDTPEDCYECPCYDHEGGICQASHNWKTDRENGCPLRQLPKWKIDGCSAFNERGGIVYDDEVFDWVKELIE